jgi:hypothetical protein
MKTIVFVFFAAILGSGFGYWRAASEAANNPHIIGEDIDLDSIKVASEAVERQSMKNQIPKNTATSGIISKLSIAKVEMPDGTSLDFGTMKRGSSRSHSFRFKNVGLAPLELTVKGSTCKCTIGSLEKSVLAPGEETQVGLKWTAEGNLSQFSQTATIGTNDPRQLEVQLSIHGKIGQSYVLEPEELSFGEFSARDGLTKTFKLYSYEETPLWVNGFWADLDERRIKVTNEVRRLQPGEVPEHADARHVADFKVEVAPGLPAGPVNGQVRLDVGETEKYPLSVRCTGKCVSDLRIVAGTDYNERANVFNAGIFVSEKGGEKLFWVAARNKDSKQIGLKLKKITPENLQGTFDVVIGEPTRNPTQTLFPVRIQVPKGCREIARGGTSSDNYIKLFFETDQEEASEISLYMKLVVEKEESINF